MLIVRRDLRWLILALAPALALAGCGGPPDTATSGERLAPKLAARFLDAPAPARETAFSPDGRILATTSVTGAIVLHAVPGWRVLRRLRHEGGATGIAFSPDGSWIASSGYDGQVRIWDAASGRPIRALGGAQGTLWTLAISPDGRTIAAAGEDRAIRLWNAADGRLLRTLHGHQRNVWEVRFSPDGRRLASGSFDRSLRLWDVASGRLLSTVSDHGQAIVGLAYSRDGSRLVTGGDDSTLRLRRAADGIAYRVIDNGNHAYKLAFSPDGRWVASAGRARGGIGTFWHQLTGGGGRAWPLKIWRASDGALIAALPAGDDLMAVAFSPDGQWLASAGEEGAVSVWHLRGAAEATGAPADAK